MLDYNIVLIGFMGAGKSTVSAYLNKEYGMEVIEMDQVIAEREKMSISDIFAVHGEEYFRNLETNLLIEMHSQTNKVISCGFLVFNKSQIDPINSLKSFCEFGEKAFSYKVSSYPR